MATIEKRIIGTGETSYRAKVRLKGFPVQTATFKRITDAKKWVQDTESSIRNGRHFKASESKKRTLAELIDRYLISVLPRKTESKKFIQNQTTQLNWWKDRLGAYFLAEITPSKISELKEVLLNEKGSAATANRYLAALSHAFTKAVREWEWIENNPVSKVDRAKEPAGRIRFLDSAERKALLKACEQVDEELYLITLLALSTGGRKGELINAKWQDVDLKKEVLIFYKTKNKEIRNIPVKGLILELLKEHRKKCPKSQEYIFSYEGENRPLNIERKWSEALNRAKILNFRFHDLRHSAASYLAMNGATLAEIAEVLGHKTLQMVKRYAHLTEAHTSTVVEKMNKKVFG